jgi:AraC-like DNA-binding protein
MFEFYRKAAAIFLGLIALTAFLAYLCVERIFVSDALLPAHESAIPWKFITITDNELGGGSSVTVNEDVYSLDYEYHLTKDIEFPFVFTVVAFAEPGKAGNPVDLSRYATATFRVKCAPRNILAFYIHSFDENFTDSGNFDSYRIATASFSCSEEWSETEIALRHLKVPMWWLEKYGADISDQDYWLDKVIAITFVNSHTGLVNAPVKVKISELTLHGRDWRYAWVFAGFLMFSWGFFIIRLFKSYTASLIADVQDKLNQDRPLIAYQQLSIEPHKDGEKSRVLRFMATEYANPDMSLEYIIDALGMSRTQINELLKDELGMTFSVYLKKLRLTEAARLLSEQEDANVAEIAYSVGYNNVSYFNKLFKNEYGCTPKTFKDIY